MEGTPLGEYSNQAFGYPPPPAPKGEISTGGNFPQTPSYHQSVSSNTMIDQLAQMRADGVI